MRRARTKGHQQHGEQRVARRYHLQTKDERDGARLSSGGGDDDDDDDDDHCGKTSVKQLRRTSLPRGRAKSAQTATTRGRASRSARV